MPYSRWEERVQMNDKAPNLLFVFSDQHRWCDLGCYGNHEVDSPHFDAFSQTAVKFDSCISNAPVCVPARGSLLTGLMPVKHRAITNDLPIRTSVESVAHVLERAGYHTGYIGKWHLGGVPRDRFIPVEERLGFSEWKVCNCSHAYMNAYYYDETNTRIEVDGYEPETQTSLAVDFIRRNTEQPWALFVSWGPPHDPYHAVPTEYLDICRDRKLSLRANVPESVTNVDSARIPELFKGRIPERFTRDDVEHMYRGYYAHITALDAQFARLRETLDSTGLTDDTVVVYTSDHGDMLGSQGLTNKQLPFEESIRIPLLVSWPGHVAPRVCNELLGLVDIPTTILGLLGLAFSGPVDGEDLHGLLLGDRSAGRESCYIFDLVPCHQAAWRGSDAWRGVRTDQYTLCSDTRGEGYMLFDNVSDPLQMRNLVDDPRFADVGARLSQALQEYVSEFDGFLPWEQLIREHHLVDEWNKSQSYFHLPTL